MTVSVIDQKNYFSCFKFYKEIHEIKMNQYPHLLFLPNISIDINSHENVLKFVSPQKKFFITLQSNYYHFHNDVVAALLKEYEKLKNSKVIIDVSDIQDKEKCTFYVFFIKVLNDLNIEYELIECTDKTIIHANNFYVLNNIPVGIINSPQIIFDFYKKYIKDININPYKKVYLARKNNNRIEENNNFYEYLRNKQFEIIYAEDFLNFEDQINYFYQVKTLMSVSGAGLTNSFFMQPNTQLIELITKHEINHTSNKTITNTEIHHFYHLSSFLKNQNYVSIPNINKDTNNIIKNLSTMEKLL